MNPIHPAPLFLGALLASLCSAQDPPVAFDEFVLVPSTIDAESITRIDSGWIDLDGQRDAVLLAGTSVCFVPNASTGNDVIVLPSVVANDCAVAGKLGSGDFDAIAVVGAGGLVRLDCTGVGEVTFTSTTIDAGGGWAGAVRVRCADLDASADADYFGVGSDLRTILVRLATAGSSTSFTVPFDVLDVMAVNWDADAALEIAVLTPGEVRIHERNGNLKERFVGDATSGDSFAYIDMPHPTRDRIVWIDHAAGGAQVLRILKPGTMESGGNLSTHAPAETFFGMSPVDIDLDGDDDVVIARTSAYEPLFLLNEFPNAPMFTAPASGATPGYLDTGSTATPAGANVCAPHCADLDADGDVDGLMCLGSANLLAVAHNLAAPFEPPPPPPGTFPEEAVNVGKGTAPHPLELMPSGEIKLVGGVPTFRVRFEPDLGIDGTVEYDVILFKQTQNVVSQPVLETTGVWYRFHFPTGVDPDDGSIWYAEVPLEDETAVCFDTLYWAQIRRVVDSPYSVSSESRIFSYSACWSIVEEWLATGYSVAYRVYPGGQQEENCSIVSGMPAGCAGSTCSGCIGFTPGPSSVTRPRLPPRQDPTQNPTSSSPQGTPTLKAN